MNNTVSKSIGEAPGNEPATEADPNTPAVSPPKGVRSIPRDFPDAEALARFAAARPDRFQPGHTIAPLYLRAPDAKLPVTKRS